MRHGRGSAPDERHEAGRDGLGSTGASDVSGLLRPEDMVAMVDHGPLATVVIDVDGTVEWASENVTEVIGVDDLAGTDIFTLLPDHEAERARAAVRAMRDFHLRTRGMVYRIRNRSGEYEPCLIAAQPHEVDGRSFVQIAIMAMPMRLVVGEAVQSVLRGASLLESLGEIEQVVNKTILGAHFAISTVDRASGTRQLIGSVPAALAGLGPDGELDDRPSLPWVQAIETGEAQLVEDRHDLPPDLEELAAEHGQSSVVVVPVVQPSGGAPTLLIGWVPVAPAAVAMLRGLEDAVAPVVALVLDRQDHLHRVRWAAEHDQLTRLENRATFHERLRTALATGDDDVAVLYLDVDRFKVINDTLGHAAGDAVLRAVAARVEVAVPAPGFCGRLGGDEFAVALPGSSEADARAVADAIVAAVADPVALDPAGTGPAGRPGSVTATVSIGVAVGSTGSDAEQLVGRADASLLEAKRARKASHPS